MYVCMYVCMYGSFLFFCFLAERRENFDGWMDGGRSLGIGLDWIGPDWTGNGMEWNGMEEDW